MDLGKRLIYLRKRMTDGEQWLEENEGHPAYEKAEKAYRDYLKEYGELLYTPDPEPKQLNFNSIEKGVKDA